MKCNAREFNFMNGNFHFFFFRNTQNTDNSLMFELSIFIYTMAPLYGSPSISDPTRGRDNCNPRTFPIFPLVNVKLYQR